VRKNKQKKENRVIRVSDRLWNKFVKACEEAGIVPSAYLRSEMEKVVQSHEKLKTQKEI